MDNIELQTFEKTTNNNEGRCFFNEQVKAGNGDGLTYNAPEAAEVSPLLKTKVVRRDGDAAESQNASVWPRDSRPTITREQMGSVCRAKRELNDVLFWRVRLWMVILCIFLLILAVIGISLFLCTVIYDDLDEKYDRSSFQTPRYFNGSFRLTNQIFSDELLNASSVQSDALSTELEQKLIDVYSSSHALARYFSKAEIHCFSNGSVIAQYQLMFVMPADHAQLQGFVLSREMVCSVFRQFLYDQESDQPDPMYIDPASLKMNVAGEMVSKQS